MLLRVLTLSNGIGLAGTTFLAAAWLGMGAALVVAASTALAAYPVIALIAAALLALPVAFGGLVSYWAISDHLEFRSRGYRVCWVAGNEWRYEEQVDGKLRSLVVVRKITGPGYPAPSEVRMPAMPEWAQGRRADVANQIGKCFGTDRGARIVFKGDAE
jgi:hypothetical protein